MLSAWENVLPLLPPAAGALHVVWLVLIRQTGTSRRRGRLASLILAAIITTALALAIPDRVLARTMFSASPFWENPVLPPLSLALLSLSTGVVYARVQRVWPFDEVGSYEAAAYYAANGWGDFFRNYTSLRWLGTQHPPLMAVIGGLWMRLAGRSIFSLRLLNVAMGTATILLTYRIGLVFFGPLPAWTSGYMLLMFPMFTRQLSSAMLEIPVCFFTTLVIWISFFNPGLAAAPWLAGLLLGAGMLFKYTTGLAFGVIAAYHLLTRNVFSALPELLVTGGLAAVILGAWLLFAYRIGALENQFGLLRKYLGSGDYTEGFRQRGWGVFGKNRLRYRFEMLSIRLPSSLGLYTLPWIAAGFYQAFTFGFAGWTLAISWLGIVTAVLLLSLPDHRYFVQLFPALAIVASLGIASDHTGFARSVLVILPLWLNALVLYCDWDREKHIFLRHLDERDKVKVSLDAG